MSRDTLRSDLNTVGYVSGKGIFFVFERDGEAAAEAFARQQMVAYRRTILKYGRSLVFYARLLREYGSAKRFVMGPKGIPKGTP